jgi:hypothetical protein
MMKRTLLLLSVFLVMSFVAFAANPVLVDSAGGGDFTNIEDAVRSWATGGSNAGETPPFVINIDPTGTYDEIVTLSDQTTTGAIVGDLVIQSSVPGTPATWKVRLNNYPTAPSAGDGLHIYQSKYDITFNDIIFCPSLISSPTDDFVKIDEWTTDSAIANEIWFNDCIFTDVEAGGNPYITSKADLLAEDYPSSIVAFTTVSGFGSGDMLMKWWNDNGENLSGGLVDCAFWIKDGYCARINLEGDPSETFLIEDCLFATGRDWHAGFEVDTNHAGQAIDIVGTQNPRFGDLTQCTAVLSSGWHPMWTSGVSGSTVTITNCIVDVDDVFGTADSRAISGGSEDLHVTDCILRVITDGGFLVNFPTNVATKDTWTRVTVNTENPVATAWLYTGSAPDPGGIQFIDSVISGANIAAWSTVNPDQGVTLINCLEATAGPDAMATDAGPVIRVNAVQDDPKFLSKDRKSASYLDTSGSALAGAASDGYGIAGGADYLNEDCSFQIVVGPIGSVYNLGDATLSESISGADLMNGKILTLSGNGYHPATVPAGDAARTATLLDGAFAANGLTVIGADTDGNDQASLTLEYDILGTDGDVWDIDDIIVFSGHDGSGGPRAFINCVVEVDQGAGYTTLVPHMLTDIFGTPPGGPTDTAVAFAKYTDPGTDADGVLKIRFTLHNVSHNSTNFFQKHNDNVTAPPSNYPNQGIVLKEIDVIGTATTPPSGITDWMLHI